MTVHFKEDLKLAPVPLAEAAAAVLARKHAASIAAAGGQEQAARLAVDAVFARHANEPPSEHSRLQRLYAHVYTRQEIGRLVLATFTALGLKEN